MRDDHWTASELVFGVVVSAEQAERTVAQITIRAAVQRFHIAREAPSLIRISFNNYGWKARKTVRFLYLPPSVVVSKGQRRVWDDQIRKAITPANKLPIPARIIFQLVVAKTKIQPAKAMKQGRG